MVISYHVLIKLAHIYRARIVDHLDALCAKLRAIEGLQAVGNLRERCGRLLLVHKLNAIQGLELVAKERHPEVGPEQTLSARHHLVNAVEVLVQVVVGCRELLKHAVFLIDRQEKFVHFVDRLVHLALFFTKRHIVQQKPKGSESRRGKEDSTLRRK